VSSDAAIDTQGRGAASPQASNSALRTSDPASSIEKYPPKYSARDPVATIRSSSSDYDDDNDDDDGGGGVDDGGDE
jgi:hypothetical protein